LSYKARRHKQKADDDDDDDNGRFNYRKFVTNRPLNFKLQ